MTTQKFNLVTDPWIKVIENQSYDEKLVSLRTLFEHAQDYRQLAGEIPTQDLAVLRMLLAILETVYDDDERMEISRWQDMYRAGHFTDSVQQYLQDHADSFDFFGEHPFCQVTEDEFNSLVPANKKIHGAEGPGQVGVKQINRTISESGHTPDIFSPKSDQFKNDVSFDELARWIITYQNISGANDKTKVKTDGSPASGWLYRLYPLYIQGDNLFETLMLNLVLSPEAKQKPVWEYGSVTDYVDRLEKLTPPDNLAELYTNWSRLLHIDWSTGKPIIFSAKLPTFETVDIPLEPMTIWKQDDDGNVTPAVAGTSTLAQPMWTKYNQIVDPTDDKVREPGVIKWLRSLYQHGGIPAEKVITLKTADLVFDRSKASNMSSQMPEGEHIDDFSIQAGVLFDEKWQSMIGSLVSTTLQVVMAYGQFISGLGRVRYAGDVPTTKTFAKNKTDIFYKTIDKPFTKWLESLSKTDDLAIKEHEWKEILRRYAEEALQDMEQASSLRDQRGFEQDGKAINIYTLANGLRYKLKRELQ